MARKNTFLPNIDRAVQQLLFTNYHIIKEEEEKIGDWMILLDSLTLTTTSCAPVSEIMPLLTAVPISASVP
jgi:hypothetical protein